MLPSKLLFPDQAISAAVEGLHNNKKKNPAISLQQVTELPF